MNRCCLLVGELTLKIELGIFMHRYRAFLGGIRRRVPLQRVLCSYSGVETAKMCLFRVSWRRILSAFVCYTQFQRPIDDRLVVTRWPKKRR